MIGSKKAIACLLIFIVSLYISKELLGNLGCQIKFTRSYLNTYNLVAQLNRTQWLYHHFEHEIDSYDRFMQTELADIPRLKYHQYSTEITENAAFNQVFEAVSEIDSCRKKAAPLLWSIFPQNKQPRYTSTGAVFFASQEGDNKDIICKSKIPGWQKLNKPYLQDNEPVCGEGTTKFIVN